jgi:RimJ/RimL family protein N-acetyltransferase
MHQPEWRASDVKDEIGWTLDPEYWGRGLATEGALAALGDVVDRVKLRRVISYTDPENMASLRVMEKCGFTYEGRAEARTRRRLVLARCSCLAVNRVQC